MGYYQCMIIHCRYCSHLHVTCSWQIYRHSQYQILTHGSLVYVKHFKIRIGITTNRQKKKLLRIIIIILPTIKIYRHSNSARQYLAQCRFKFIGIRRDIQILQQQLLGTQQPLHFTRPTVHQTQGILQIEDLVANSVPFPSAISRTANGLEIVRGAPAQEANRVPRHESTNTDKAHGPKQFLRQLFAHSGTVSFTVPQTTRQNSTNSSKCHCELLALHA